MQDPHTAYIEDAVNQEFGPIIDRALARARALLPPEIELVHELSHGHARVRGDAVALENLFTSACILAWHSVAGQSARIVVETAEVVMDEVVLTDNAETLKGGLPPRRYVHVVVSNDKRQPPGPLHLRMRPPPAGGPPASARRLRLIEMRSVVSDHKGMFSVATEPALGTGFDMYLPTAAPLDRQSVSGSGGELRHVVYIDDYSGMRELIEEVLPDAGFRVTSFDRAMPALKFLQTSACNCDAVVSDYKLTDLDGLELLKQIKRLHPDLPVIIVSGYVDDTLRARALERGASAVLSKTQDLEALCEVLHDLLPSLAQAEAGSFTDWASL
jgi:two-component system cell cycle sensor histidine kinase/response regulator CckA